MVYKVVKHNEEIIGLSSGLLRQYSNENTPDKLFGKAIEEDNEEEEICIIEGEIQRLKTAVVKLCPKNISLREGLDVLFNKYDEDGGGTIDPDEFESMLNEICPIDQK